jgi:hypothetical protein
VAGTGGEHRGDLARDPRRNWLLACLAHVPTGAGVPGELDELLDPELPFPLQGFSQPGQPPVEPVAKA